MTRNNKIISKRLLLSETVGAFYVSILRVARFEAGAANQKQGTDRGANGKRRVGMNV